MFGISGRGMFEILVRVGDEKVVRGECGCLFVNVILFFEFFGIFNVFFMS